MKTKSILEVLDEANIPYEVSGNLYKCFCVFHQDNNTPNMFIYPETNTFHCFACGAGHSLITLTCKLFNLTKKEAFNKIFGPDYIKDLLNLQRGDLKNPDYYIDKTVSEYIRKSLQSIKKTPENIQFALSRIEEIDSVYITKENIGSIIHSIGRWGNECPIK